GDRRLRCGRAQSQFVFTRVRVEHPLVCGVDVLRPPTALRVHGRLNPPSGPRGAFPLPRRSGLGVTARDLRTEPVERCTGSAHTEGTDRFWVTPATHFSRLQTVNNRIRLHNVALPGARLALVFTYRCSARPR